MILHNKLIDKIDNEEVTLIIEDENSVIIEDSNFGVICLVENYNKISSAVNVYDKLIGRGAALLMTKLNLKNVYAKTITTEAIEILRPLCNLKYSREVEHILNRDRSDLCPIEKIAKDKSDVEELYFQLKDFYVERGYIK